MHLIRTHSTEPDGSFISMDIVTASGIVREARRSVDAGGGLGGTGFWKLIGAIKRDPGLDRLVDDVAEIDQKAFENWAFLTVPLALGTTLMILGTVVGLVLVSLAYQAEGIWSGVWILLGTGVLLVTTHGLAHLAVGMAVGIRFTFWFIGKVSQPQPGVKTDYSTYLRTPARSRAWMHAAGAATTKVIPFLMVGAALAADVPDWATWTLVVVGVVTVITDVLWSTKASDWKKFQREMAFAQES
ncbi:hypothetical protein BH23ACT4_BH23ACT4_16060 [soil metagenome]